MVYVYCSCDPCALVCLFFFAQSAIFIATRRLSWVHRSSILYLLRVAKPVRWRMIAFSVSWIKRLLDHAGRTYRLSQIPYMSDEVFLVILRRRLTQITRLNSHLKTRMSLQTYQGDYHQLGQTSST